MLSLPQLAVRALQDHLDRQAEDRLLAGVRWADHGLVLTSAVGTPLDRHNVLREFRKITQAAGLGTDWVPREMRHTFVSLLSSNGTALEDIADLAGHRGTTTTAAGRPAARWEDLAAAPQLNERGMTRHLNASARSGNHGPSPAGPGHLQSWRIPPL